MATDEPTINQAEEPQVIEIAPPPPEDQFIKLPFGRRLRKKIFYTIVLPLVAVGLLLVGLIEQGFVSSWFGGLKQANIAITVLDEQSKPIVQANVIIAQQATVTDDKGGATLTNIADGNQALTVRKTGYITYQKTVTLARGSNDLGQIILQSQPATRVSPTLKLTNYITEAPIANATITLEDLRPTFANRLWQFKDVPVGSYKLTITRDGFTSYAADVTVGEKTSSLDPVALVPSGSVAFETVVNGLRTIQGVGLDGLHLNTQLVPSSGGSSEDFTPVESPNGQKLALLSTRDGSKQAGTDSLQPYLYVENLSDATLSKVDSSTSVAPLWAPDSSRLSYLHFDSQTKDNLLRVYSLANHKISNFALYNVNDYQYAFSPDGTKIAFSGQKEGGLGTQLYIANSDSTNVTLVEAQDCHSLEFTATGKLRYAYVDSNTNDTHYIEYDPANGTKAETTTPAIDKVGATLSPDGELRAYVSTRNGKSNLFVSGPDGKNEIQLTDSGNLVADSLLWATDSSYVLYSTQSAGESGRYAIAVTGEASAKKITEQHLSWYFGQ